MTVNYFFEFIINRGYKINIVLEFHVELILEMIFIFKQNRHFIYSDRILDLDDAANQGKCRCGDQ